MLKNQKIKNINLIEIYPMKQHSLEKNKIDFFTLKYDKKKRAVTHHGNNPNAKPKAVPQRQRKLNTEKKSVQ